MSGLECATLLALVRLSGIKGKMMMNTRTLLILLKINCWQIVMIIPKYLIKMKRKPEERDFLELLVTSIKCRVYWPSLTNVHIQGIQQIGTWGMQSVLESLSSLAGGTSAGWRLLLGAQEPRVCSYRVLLFLPANSLLSEKNIWPASFIQQFERCRWYTFDLFPTGWFVKYFS